MKTCWPEEVYIDPIELIQQLNIAYPEQFKDVQLPPQTQRLGEENDEKLIRLFLWHYGEDDPRMRIKSLNAQEAFSVYIKGSLLVGVLLASPWLFIKSGTSWRRDSIRTNGATSTCICPLVWACFWRARCWLSSWCSSRC